MPRRIIALAWIVCSLLAMVAPVALAADDPKSIVSQADLNAALSKRVNDTQAARDTVKNLLRRDDVRALAEGYGLDARRAETAVDTLQGGELQALATQAAQLDAQLAGGDVVISVSLIALLLIIIIVILLTQN
jgi:hypothetical protein